MSETEAELDERAEHQRKRVIKTTTNVPVPVTENWQSTTTRVNHFHLKKAHLIGRLTNSFERTNFFALALAGEVGELCNLLKKIWRGDEYNEAEMRKKLADEMADIQIYIHHLAEELGIDLEEACRNKAIELKERLKL
jgi:NTP pyrophosphatase (non-canonical NTP hydrolase)